MDLRLGLGLSKQKKILRYPIFQLTGKYSPTLVNAGGDLLPMLPGGTIIPKVGEDNGEAVYNFGVLNDNRFDKGCYDGNSYGLPVYYNWPFENIYYTATPDTQPETRYYWKFSDFHYANLLAQTINIPNYAFLKATATTNTSNEIAESKELLIFTSDYTETTCYSSGTFYKASNQAYGVVFEGDIYMDKPGYRINFISDRENANINDFYGYQFSYESSIFLSVVNNGSRSTLIASNTSNLSLKTWYRIKIARSESGEFRLYVRGGEYGDVYTLLPADVAGSNPNTNNTYTTSDYKVLVFNADNKLKIEGEDFNTWTQGTGKYAHYNNGEQSGSALTPLKNYIGIQADFEGDELIINGGYNNNFTGWSSGYNVIQSIVSGNGFEGNAGRADATGTFPQYGQALNIISGEKYKVDFKYRSSTELGVRLSGSDSVHVVANANTDDAISISTEIVATVTGTSGFIFLGKDGDVGDWFENDNVSVKQIYQNYYKAA